jgi:hypothetical protein
MIGYVRLKAGFYRRKYPLLEAPVASVRLTKHVLVPLKVCSEGQNMHKLWTRS